jgi:two-component system NtrC family sensor kinase
VLLEGEALWGEGALPAPVLAAARASLSAAAETTHLIYQPPEGSLTELCSFTPILGTADGAERGTVVFQRLPLQPWTAYAASGMRRITTQALLVLLLTALASIWAGQLLVSRPLELLAQFARQISTGDFDPAGKLALTGEFVRLERALRQMAATLAETSAQLRQETEDKARALEHLRHTDRLRTVGTLAAGIAHDLGTPMQIVLARAERLVRKSPDERARASAEIIVEQTLRMDQIVRQLMRFAAPRTAPRQTQDLRPIVARACELVAPLDRKIALHLMLPDSPLAVLIDTEHAEQIVINLVANAIDASEEGDAVEVSLERTTSPNGAPVARILIVDQGCGMSPETVEQVFDPFFSTKDIGRGTGLGLAVVYGIVKEYGGRVQLSSTEGIGSRFEILLPTGEEAHP